MSQARCTHGFRPGYCSALGCANAERVLKQTSATCVRTTAKRVGFPTCRRCRRALGVVMATLASGKPVLLCRGCAERPGTTEIRSAS